MINRINSQTYIGVFLLFPQICRRAGKKAQEHCNEPTHHGKIACIHTAIIRTLNIDVELKNGGWCVLFLRESCALAAEATEAVRLLFTV